MTVEMKDIPGFEGFYAVTTDGKVWSYPKTGVCPHNGKFLKARTHRGYAQVVLRINGKSITHKIHRLVAITFIPNPIGKKNINHINRNRSDNNIQNLEWCTTGENNYHAWTNPDRFASEKQRNAARKNGVKCSKPVMQLTKEGILCKIYRSIREAEAETGCIRQHISSCALGKPRYKTCGGYMWKYS